MDPDSPRTAATEAGPRQVDAPPDPDPDPAEAEAHALVRSVHDLEVDPPAPPRPQ